MSPHDDEAPPAEGDPQEADAGDILLAASSVASALNALGTQTQVLLSARDPALQAVLQRQMADAKRHVARVLDWMRAVDPQMDAALRQELFAGALRGDPPAEEPTAVGRTGVPTEAAVPGPAASVVPGAVPAPAPVSAPLPVPARTTSGPVPPVGPGPVTFVKDVRLDPTRRIRG
jgi:hypothetical protein